MKKCTSCTKDLPDSALHCVFCGAKQAPAPVPGAAAQQAKTVLGYQAADVMKEMQRGGSGGRPPMGPPMSQPPRGQPMPPSMASAPPPSQAPTMFVPHGSGPGPMMAPAPAPPPPMQMPSYSAPTVSHSPPMNHQGVPMPLGQGPSGPAAVPPYLASQSAARAVRPIEPYADGLKLVMLSFGILLLGAFATPLSTNPMAFHWNVIVDAPGIAKLFSLMLASTGVLALVIAMLPLGAVGRGTIAAGLGVFMVATPIIQAGDIGAWQVLAGTLGSLAIVAGLLLRHEYREAMLGRLLTTVGAAVILLTYLIPVGDTVPLVGIFQALIDAPGELKVQAILFLIPAILAIVSLLCWMPAPATAGAKPIAWIWIVWPAVLAVTTVALHGDFGGSIKQSPFIALMIWVPSSAAVAFVGYGVASVLGKQLE